VAPPPQRIRVELHSHTRHSRDCLLSPEAIIAACQRRGIGALAVTDHNEIEGAFELQRLAPFPVIVGEEVFTEQGEIIGLFLREYIPRGLPAHETVARIKAQGGLVYVPHPFDSYRQGAVGRETLDAIRTDVDLLEVFNARNLQAEDDEQAYAYAWEHGLTMAAGSDAHSVGEFGNAYLEMEPFDGPQDFLAKARRGRLRVRRSTGLVHLLSSYAKVHKQAARRLGLAR
jgi:predicted metal-dependent phosphoesterase TrpH